MTEEYGLPHPDWARLIPAMNGRFAEGRLPEAWNTVVRDWMSRLAAALRPPYAVTEHPRVLLVSPLPMPEARGILDFIWRAIGAIRASLGPIADEGDDYLRVVTLFQGHRRFLDYISHYYPDDSHTSMPGGMLMRSGYLHIVGMVNDTRFVRSMLVHELTHLLLTDRDMPGWLEEAVTQAMEDHVLGTRFVPTRELMERQRAFWAEHGLDEFWTGAAFHRPDEGCELAYRLSELLAHPLMMDRPREFLEFAARARSEDFGAAAAIECLGMTLGELAARPLGPGDWEPPPPEPNEAASE